MSTKFAMTKMEKIVIKALAVSVVVVTLLTLVNFGTDHEVLLDLITPGLIVTMLVTGGHGGNSLTAEMIGMALGFYVNVVMYFVLFAGLFLIHHWLVGLRPPK